MSDVIKARGPKVRPHIQGDLVSGIHQAEGYGAETKVIHPGYILNYSAGDAGIDHDISTDMGNNFGSVVSNTLDSSIQDDINEKYDVLAFPLNGSGITLYQRLTKDSADGFFYHMAGFKDDIVHKRIILNKSASGMPGDWSEVFDVNIDTDLGVVVGGTWWQNAGEIFAFDNGNILIVTQFTKADGTDSRIITVDKNGNLVNILDGAGQSLHEQDLSGVADINSNYDSNVDGGLFRKNAFSHKLQSGYIGVERTYEDGGEEIYKVAPTGITHVQTLPESTGIGNLTRITMDEKSAQFYISDMYTTRGGDAGFPRTHKSSLFRAFGLDGNFAEIPAQQAKNKVLGIGFINKRDSLIQKTASDQNEYRSRGYLSEAENDLAEMQEYTTLFGLTQAGGDSIEGHTQHIAMRRNRRRTDNLFVFDDED